MPLSDSYYRIKARADIFKKLRQYALDSRLYAAAESYGWSAIRLQQEALDVAAGDLGLSGNARRAASGNLGGAI